LPSIHLVVIVQTVFFRIDNPSCYFTLPFTYVPERNRVGIKIVSIRLLRKHSTTLRFATQTLDNLLWKHLKVVE